MKVALLGYGNVGGGAYDIICEMKGGLAVKRILARSIRPGMEAVMTTDFKDILNDEEIDIVAETIGGLHPAYEYVTEALKAKKHVVSANKQLICHYYSELMALAVENGVQLRFTSSAGGGVPWLFNLIRAKRCDEITEISGIMNSTTNFILYSMTEKGLPFGAALSEAQRLGYAEADPSADIDGNDAQRKCAISASVAFEGAVAEDSVDVFGIRHITDKDIRAFKKMGRVCKLMVKAKKHKDGISAYVEPALLPLSAPESSVTMNFNMTTLVGKNIGRLSLMGQGAGKYPTGSSLVQDMLDIKCNAIGPCAPKKAIRADNSLERHSYYLRTSAITAELRQLGQMVNGEYIITEPLTVSEMHAMAKRLQKSDPDMFFAGIE